MCVCHLSLVVLLVQTTLRDEKGRCGVCAKCNLQERKGKDDAPPFLFVTQQVVHSFCSSIAPTLCGRTLVLIVSVCAYSESAQHTFDREIEKIRFLYPVCVSVWGSCGSLGFPFEKKGEVGAVHGLRLRSGVTARAFALLCSPLSLSSPPHRYIYTKV